MTKYTDIIKMFIPAKKLFRGLKNASYLTIAHIVSMFINLVGFIFIARILGPSNYGIYATVGAFIGLFWLLTFNGITKVILREGAKDLTKMGWFIERTIGVKIFFTFIAINICIACSSFMPYTLQEKIFIIIFSASLIYRSFNDFFGAVFQAAEKMQYNAVLTILERILFIPLSIIFLIMGFGLLGLFSISLFSQFFILVISYKLTKKFTRFKFFNRIRWDISLLKPALVFSIISFSVLLTSRIDIVMISLLGTTKDVGIYGVANSVIHQGVITRNLVALAFFPIFIKAFHQRLVKWKRLLKYAFLISCGVFILAIVGSLFSTQIITLLFGEEYLESGIILSTLIFYLAFTFFSIPFSNILQATHNEKYFLIISWIGPCLNIGLNLLFFKIFGLIGIAYSTLVVGIVNLPIFTFITWKILKRQNRII